MIHKEYCVHYKVHNDVFEVVKHKLGLGKATQ